MADPQRMRNITFKTPVVAAKLNRVKAQAWKIVAHELDVLLDKEISKRVTVRRGPKGGVIKTRSKPGEPPRTETGNLKRKTSVIYRKGSVVVRTTNYGAWLDGGTRNILARPWVHSVIFKKRKTIDKRANVVMKTLAGK